MSDNDIAARGSAVTHGFERDVVVAFARVRDVPSSGRKVVKIRLIARAA
jgi:hypothetical protein